MDYQLVVLRGRSVSSAVKLADGVTTAGRQEDCQLRIKSSQVSRKHCQFFEKNGFLLIKDLGSSNGSFVNGERIQGQRVLEPGDEIAIGPINFRVEKIGAAAMPAEAPSTKVAGKPGDTAITQGASPTKEAVPDDEFEIIFDEEPAAVETVALSDDNAVVPTAPAPARPAPVPTPAAVATPAAPAPPVSAPAPPTAAAPTSLASARKPTPAPAPPPPAAEPESDFADEAVADFLSNLKIDDDD
jgi:predicted component of type VI protein secretion system